MAEISPSARKSLTARQQAWLEHLDACRAEGSSLRAYAAANGLSAAALYSARRELKRRGVFNGSGASGTRARFVAVRVRAPVTYRVVLTNGVIVEVPEQAEPTQCQALVSALSGGRS